MRNQWIAISATLLALTGAAADENWSLHGGSKTDQRFSSLNQINEKTISTLGLVWSKELGTTRGLEATPIVENGII
jgi:quinohemoprotein ethanol dehydrogenase